MKFWLVAIAFLKFGLLSWQAVEEGDRVLLAATIAGALVLGTFWSLV